MLQNDDLAMVILNFLQLDENTGTGGQPTAEQFDTLLEAGFQVVINLALPTSDNALANEGALVTRRGMTYIHIPVIWERPRVEDFSQFAHIMQALQGMKVFVHCARNLRAACFMYLYRTIYQDVPRNAARRDLLKIWKPNETWQALMDAVRSSHINLREE
jgi:protein tyrosine phosphatase (PTP) superfamily phosphohydrolase (DUF442 family)